MIRSQSIGRRAPNPHNGSARVLSGLRFRRSVYLHKCHCLLLLLRLHRLDYWNSLGFLPLFLLPLLVVVVLGIPDAGVVRKKRGISILQKLELRGRIERNKTLAWVLKSRAVMMIDGGDFSPSQSFPLAFSRARSFSDKK